ncbi:hypothetical protein Acor_29030 [Acrocarpospora corrugata]|uniref:Uncharacterized protein n=1 Tax=Acrocarpospora corrugata TaxID=35763 RepID=A0A5M3VXG6_9ACTN|nr:hypothetical protein [Acrocarpospora corrugata]GES00839.1 hypothetical protein Acor_29030 [Acrocarpospora corrugata]
MACGQPHVISRILAVVGRQHDVQGVREMEIEVRAAEEQLWMGVAAEVLGLWLSCVMGKFLYAIAFTK